MNRIVLADPSSDSVRAWLRDNFESVDRAFKRIHTEGVELPNDFIPHPHGLLLETRGPYRSLSWNPEKYPRISVSAHGDEAHARKTERDLGSALLEAGGDPRGFAIFVFSPEFRI